MGTLDNGSTGLFLFVEIRNTGEMPSIADSWRIVLSPPSGPDIAVTLTHFEQMKLQMQDGSRAELTAADTIYERVELTPIAFGAKTLGWIGATTPLSLTQINVPGMKVVMSFCDVLGKRYEASHVISGHPAEPRYYPGIRTGVEQRGRK
jgi:hypothetical protein